LSQKQEVRPKRTVAPILMYAEKLRAERKPDEALRVVSEHLNEHFDDVPALVLASHILIDSERIGMAHSLSKLAAQMWPDESICWNNLGICYQKAWLLEDAEKCFLKALSRDKDDPLALCNLSYVYLEMGLYDKALSCADKAIKLDPKIPEGRYNRGVALLAMRQWEEGWKGYEYNLGKHQGRRERVYGTVPRWTGVNGLKIIAYGEQGIGDEISFASCIPDLQKENEVVIECDHRLEGLFRRSFNCKVYGTLRDKRGPGWFNEEKPDASVAMGSLPGFYRNSDESFPGTPYLVADPERRLQWKSLLDSLGSKMKVGIAWTGGIKRTGDKKRSLELDDLSPILRQDATFVSLQYKDSPEIEEFQQKTGIKVHHWKHATQTEDYDDTAALVAELDLVITVQQTAVHIAGALGVPCWAMIPRHPLWRYGVTGDTLPWAKSVKLYRQKGDWIHTIADVATDLRKLVQSRA